MFGRIRASPSSLDSLEGSPPSKILKDDSFSIYEATLMKLKLGAKRDKPPMKTEEKEFTNDFPVTDEANMDVDCTPATGIAEASSSIGDNDDKATLMDTDCCSCVATMTSPVIITGVRDSVSTENNTESPRQNNVSIRKFYSLLTNNSSSCGSASSSGSVVSNGDTRSGLCE
ncbi:uncharacterized protein LOC131636831 [Vicia villosa]|uniref:uncharacterized protein LOC131636831 n=1 Tax=Vicia villosa TaxID=3911 RepID=UPI00273C8371|nr:uncharacterized protein LOC131636831 [Vicia villosa]